MENSKYIFRGDIVISVKLLISSNYLCLYNPLPLMYLGQFAQYICSVNIGSRAWVPKTWEVQTLKLHFEYFTISALK